MTVYRPGLVFTLAVMLAWATLLVATAGCDTNDLGSLEDESVRTLLEDLNELSTFTTSMDSAGLLDTLDGPGAYTLFAPRNAAFDGLDVLDSTARDDVLLRVVRHHLVVGENIYASDITDGASWSSLEGGTLTLHTQDGISVNGASVVTPDVDASNGVIHIIDQVLSERLNAYQRILVTDSLEQLQAIVDTAGASTRDLLQDESSTGRTVLAPSNQAVLDAFDANGDNTLDPDELAAAHLGRILQNHIVPGTIASTDLPESPVRFETFTGEELVFVRNGTTVTIFSPAGDTAVVQTPDIRVRNGVLHTIDGLLPPQPD